MFLPQRTCACSFEIISIVFIFITSLIFETTDYKLYRKLIIVHVMSQLQSVFISAYILFSISMSVQGAIVFLLDSTEDLPDQAYLSHISRNHPIQYLGLAFH